MILLRANTLPPDQLNFAYGDKYVIHYDFSNTVLEQAEDDLNVLIKDLEAVGLQVEVRAGFDKTLLVFVKAPKHVLGSTIHKSRVKDWLYGITPAQPAGDKEAVADPSYEAEAVLSMYHLVGWPKELGGAAIIPRHGRWANVCSIFPIHNPVTNQSLLRHLGARLVLQLEDLDKIRDLFGPKVAFYFAFTQTYILALFFPSITGLLAWAFFPQHSLVYAILTGLWCTVFLEYWKIRQRDLSIRWNVTNVGTLKINRPQFRYEKVFVDEFGNTEYVYSRWKTVCRQVLQVPFVALAAAILAALISVVFLLEILISDAYNGPYKTALEYLPTVLLAIAIPYISSFFEDVADMLTRFENHRTSDEHEMSRTQKIFVLNFISNYMPILLTAFVYVPFGDAIIPRLAHVVRRLEHVIGRFVVVDADQRLGHFAPPPVDRQRLRNAVIALTLTGQVQHFCEEFLYPFAKQTLRRRWRDYRGGTSDLASLRRGGGKTGTAGGPEAHQHPEDMPFLNAARNQSVLEPYNVQEDISQMVIQYGHLCLFSPAWPLVAVGFLFNNWLELRSDFLKICIEHRRPAPDRSDGIGPWVDSLAFLNWFGSITTAAIVHLFGHEQISALLTGLWHFFSTWVAFEKHGQHQHQHQHQQQYDPYLLDSATANNLAGTAAATAASSSPVYARSIWWTLPITIFITEHAFLGLRALVQWLLQRVGSNEIRRQRREEYAHRKRRLDELEAEKSSVAHLTVEQRRVHRKQSVLLNDEPFFARQAPEGRSLEVGVELIKALKAS